MNQLKSSNKSDISQNFTMELKSMNETTIRVALVRGQEKVTQCGFDWAIGSSKYLCKKPGFALELMLLILKNLNLRPEFVVPKSGLFGGLNGSRWDGIVGLLARNEADVSVPVLSQTEEREKVISFTRNSLLTKKHMFFVHSPSFLWIQGLWQPFRAEVWVCLLFCYVLTIVACALSASLMNDTQSGLHCKRCPSFSGTIRTYWYALLFEKRSVHMWTHASLKVNLFVWSLMGKFAVLSFAAIFVRNCTAKVVQEIPFHNFDTLTQAIENQGYQWLTSTLSDIRFEDVFINQEATYKRLR